VTIKQERSHKSHNAVAKETITHAHNHAHERNQSMKTLLTLALFAAILVASMLPSAPMNTTTADLLAGRSGTGTIKRPYSPDEPDLFDIHTPLASGVIIGTIRRPRA
jgi:hypothetical protein